MTIESNNKNKSACSFNFLLSPVDSKNSMLEPTIKQRKEEEKMVQKEDEELLSENS